MSIKYIQPEGKNGKHDPVFIVRNNKIIGTTDNINITLSSNSGELIINKLSYSNIYNNPELWFLINKGEEYLFFSHKNAILYEILNNDLFNYVTDF